MSEEQLPTPGEFAEMLGQDNEDLIDLLISIIGEGEDE